jgi:hypothetical protein
MRTIRKASSFHEAFQGRWCLEGNAQETEPAIVFIFAVVFYLYRSRLLGIKPKVMPKSRSELVFGFLLAIFFGSVTALTIVFSVNEIWWASYAGGVIAALALGFTMHYYPSGEYKKGKHQND